MNKGEKGGASQTTQSSTVSAPLRRWNPTPEQVHVLKEAYRGGIITPNVSQIEQLTATISVYGKVEQRNVFFWFQNHKNREKQKLKKLEGSHIMHDQRRVFSNSHLEHRNMHEPQIRDCLSSHSLCRLSDSISNGSISQAGVHDILMPIEGEYSSNHHLLGKCVPKYKHMIIPTYTQDWMSALNMQSVSPSASSKCLETLELFPTMPTGLKDTTSSK